MTLSDLSGDCETCGTRAIFTGNVKVEGGRYFALVRCPDCKVTFSVYRKSAEATIQAYLSGKARLADALSFDTAWVVLRSGDAARVERLLSYPVAELPLFGVEDIALNANSAEKWGQLLLEWRGWVPNPDAATRLEEALAAAIQFGSDRAAAGVATRVGAWEPAGFRSAFARLPARTAGKNARVVGPVLAALRQRGGDWAAAAEFAAGRWVNTPMAGAAVGFMP